MTSKRRYLPSLGAFATFEVAAKHLSFTQAGAELNVTQAAISQHIRGLEKALGVSLFKRLHNALELTPEGKRLLTSVTAGLDGICDAITEINRPDTRDAVITISGTNAAMALWLKPLIGQFQQIHPDACFEVLASDENDRLRNFDNVDLSLICGNERCDPGERMYYLFAEVAQPMCSPSFLEVRGPMLQPDGLQGCDLLELHAMHWQSEAIGWLPLTWATWFRDQDCTAPEGPYRLVSNNYPLLVDAAVAGQGLILGWHHLVGHLVAEGALCVLFDAPLQIDRGYYLKVNALTAEKPLVQELVDLIRTEAAKAPGLAGAVSASAK